VNPPSVLTRLAVVLSFGLTLAAAEPPSTQLVAIDQRAATSLNGDWHYIVDPYGTGLYDFHGHLRPYGYFMNGKPQPGGEPVEYDFAKMPTLRVPGDWNTQRDALFYYESLLWYQRDFTFQPKPGHRAFLHVGAANYRSHAWINGQKVCQHEGGFTAFDCEITTAVHAGSNAVVIAVDATRIPDGAPTWQTDWWNYGGLTRDVSIVDLPAQFIDDYSLQLKRGTTADLEGWVHVEGAAPGTVVTLKIAALNITETAKVETGGRARFEFQAPGLVRWEPGSPKLYDVELRAGEDTLRDEIGFRTIEVRGTQILLNGKPIFLNGICLHAEAPIRTGRAYSDDDAKTLLGWVRELGANFARLAHYPHDQRMTRLADRMGILIWSEIPVYWACQFENPEVLAKAQQQLREMIRRDRNKASVILWSVANETPGTAARTAFLKTMVATAREEDPSRLITAALLVRTEGMKKYVDDPLGAALDVIGTNEYVGWYEHTPEDADQTTWQISYQKPLIMSEFGGDARFGLHGDASTRWTEEYQANLYRHQFVMLNKIPQLRGLSPWILMDFRSPRRILPGVQDNFNRKGLLSEKGEKKQSFYILQDAYKRHAIGKPE
jgi:beta-glucuronidase